MEQITIDTEYLKQVNEYQKRTEELTEYLITHLPANDNDMHK